MSKKHAMTQPVMPGLPQPGPAQWDGPVQPVVPLQSSPDARQAFLAQRANALAEFESTPLWLTITDLSGNVLARVVAEPKHFSTGSRGFYATGKVNLGPDQAKYQVSSNLVRVGSKGQQDGQ